LRLAESFARSVFAKFVNSPAGRITRIVAGLGLIGWGYTQRAEWVGIALMVIGLVPLAAGVFHLCLVSALLGGPLSGPRVIASQPPS
jgi:Inner membrane protein YgaP-like, transmembrane domain